MMNVDLTETLGRFVAERVVAGEFHDSSEVISAALRLLKARSDRRQARLKRFQFMIQEGLDDFEAGRFEEIADLTRWFDDLEAEVDAVAPGGGS